MAEHEKSDSLPRMQHRRPGQLPYQWISGLNVGRGSAGPAGGLPQPREADPGSLRVSVEMSEETGFAL